MKWVENGFGGTGVGKNSSESTNLPHIGIENSFKTHLRVWPEQLAHDALFGRLSIPGKVPYPVNMNTKKTLFRIRICGIRTVSFRGLPDPDPYINKQKMKKNLDFDSLVTFKNLLSLKTDVHVPNLSNTVSKKNFWKNF
jgi:hypothetical protein